MTPGGRLSAAIEILDAVIAGARDEGAAADTLIARYFAARRYAGSKDRRAVRELVYDVIRCAPVRPESGRAAVIAYAGMREPALLENFGGDGHSPTGLAEGEVQEVHAKGVDFAVSKLRDRFGEETDREVAALLARAPLDLRVNRLKATRSEVAAMLPPTEPTQAPDGLRAVEAFAVEAHPAFLNGLFEVQDTGSQMACAACEAGPGMTVVDLCAGAGGKTLGLAAAMANQGRLIACDTDRGRLGRMEMRAARAGATIAQRLLLDPNREAEAVADLAGAADVVLIDAPCSGTGTWRRNPEARWRLTEARLARLTALQSRLLDIAAPLVRPSGRLVYVVCSLIPDEGERQVEAFLARTPGWRRMSDDLVLTPAQNGTDGFFVAILAPI